MTNDTDLTPEVLIKGIEADFDPDGTLTDRGAIEVSAKYIEVDEHRFDPEAVESDEEREDLAESYDPGDVIHTEFHNGAYARLRYEVDDDGVARLSEFKDAEPESAGWASVGFLRTVHAAEGVVTNVPGVEQVVNAEDTLFEELAASDDADIRRA